MVEVDWLQGRKKFCLSIAYGHNWAVDRRELWAEMRTVNALIVDSAWIQIGDFNAVRSVSERTEGFDAADAMDFNYLLKDICQEDVPAKRFWYSWTNKRGGNGENKSRIDRIIHS